MLIIITEILVGPKFTYLTSMFEGRDEDMSFLFKPTLKRPIFIWIVPIAVFKTDAALIQFETVKIFDMH